jgi:hypothetical protein
MNPNSVNPSAAIAAGGIVAIVFVVVIYVAFLVLMLYIGYRITKAAVRNGMVEALKKTGFVDPSGRRIAAAGPAPVQGYGAPLPPSVDPTQR